jgi:hypothetical protein
MKIPSGERLKGEWTQVVGDKKRRYLLIAGAVLLLSGLAFRLYPYYEGMMGGETDIAATKNRIAKYRQVVKGKGELEARLVSVKKSLEQAEAGLLTGKTAALAAVDIQNTLNEIALASGVEIKSMQVLKSQDPKKDAELYVSVPVQFSVLLTIRQLKDILYKIEASPKFFLTVEWIRTSVAGTGAPGQIRCDIAVSGIMKNVKE